MTSDCRSCRHNIYKDIDQWIDCNHPIAIERGPRWQEGDPAIVSWRTSDVPFSDIPKMGECPTWEAIE